MEQEQKIPSSKIGIDLESLLESSMDGIWVCDGKGNTLYVNEACGRFYDIEPKELIGKNVLDLINAGYFSDSAAINAIKTGNVVTQETKSRTGKRFLLTARPIFGSNGLVWRVVTNVRDVTEIFEINKKLEENLALSHKYETELEELRQEQILKNTSNLIARSSQMKQILNIAYRIARAECNVLILGDSGVGKEAIAKMIHKTSNRNKDPFIVVNCGAIPEKLMESELFGFEKGSFTDAKQQKIGLFELANGGTLFLDEIGDLPLGMQVKILRAIQEREIMRIGGKKQINLDVRIIAATNKNLEEMVSLGTFRDDLFYRLNVVQIVIPPLRERIDDIPPLIIFFLNKFNSKYNCKKNLAPGLLNVLTNYNWPGNIRELENVVESMIVLCPYDIIGIEYLPNKIVKTSIGFQENDIVPLKYAVEQAEKRVITLAMERYKSSRKAAEVLKVNHVTITRKIKKYKINFNSHEFNNDRSKKPQ